MSRARPTPEELAAEEAHIDRLWAGLPPEPKPPRSMAKAKPRGSGSNEPAGKRIAVLVRADSLKPEAIRWAWKPRLAFGKMAMVAGDPGLGKSTVLTEIVALHTRGGEFPLGEGRAQACEAVYLMAEDGLRDTLIPRLMAAEADLTKVHFLTGTRVDGSGEEDAMFDIGKDVAALRAVFTNNPNIKILVIDPLTAYLGSDTKAKENTEVRRVLSPLVKLIDDFGVLLLANNHLNKSGGKALYRVLDSIAFVALGRVVHLIAADADNSDLKKFLCSKTNIGPLPKGISYIIQTVWIKGEQGEEIETTRIAWGTQYIDETADEALAPDTAGTATDEAVEFLRMVLARGRAKIHDIEIQAREAGLLGDDQQLRLSKPFRSARKVLKIVFSRDGFGPGAICYWSLPEHTSPPDIGAIISATSNRRAPMTPRALMADDASQVNGSVVSSSLHTCPQPPYAPSQDEGTHDGKYGNHEGPEQRVCIQCRGEVDGTEQQYVIGGQTVWLHLECRRFFTDPPVEARTWALGQSVQAVVAGSSR